MPAKTLLALFAFLAVGLLSASSAVALDESVAGAALPKTQTKGEYSLPTHVTFEGEDYRIGGPLTVSEMKLMVPGATWVYYHQDRTEFEYHTFDGYVLVWIEGRASVFAGAWQFIENRICWTFNSPYCRRIWRTEREDLFALPAGPDQPLLPARFEVGDPLGLSNRQVHWLVTQSQNADEREALNPPQQVTKPVEDRDSADRSIDENGAPQTFSFDDEEEN